MNDYQKFWEDKMNDPEFRAYSEEMKPEYNIAMGILAGRMRLNLSQKELSALSGVSLKDIERLENMDGNPDLQMLKRIAKALDLKIAVDLSPNKVISVDLDSMISAIASMEYQDGLSDEEIQEGEAWKARMIERLQNMKSRYCPATKSPDK